MRCLALPITHDWYASGILNPQLIGDGQVIGGKEEAALMVNRVMLAKTTRNELPFIRSHGFWYSVSFGNKTWTVAK